MRGPPEGGFSGGDKLNSVITSTSQQLEPTDKLSASFDALSLDTSAADPRWELVMSMA